jgi:alkaline phosphatase
VLSAQYHNKKMIEGRGDWMEKATKIALQKLSENEKGFFLMIEGSFIDKACHENEVDYLLSETLDFDKTVGLVKEFAEKNGETLVIVTADHETGGLSIMDGEIKKGEVELNFAKIGGSTQTHTGIMVPVFTFGPGAYQFTGVYENTEIFHKMKNLLNL